MQHIIDRFISYVIIDTESDSSSDTTPSTKKQWDLANKLVEELKAIGMQDVTIDDKAYIMATLPSNVDYEVPTIGFISHFDTSPDFSGANVKPQIVSNYDGKDIVLNAEQNIVLSPSYFKDLLQYKGHTLITTDGTTLLGADDKAGITEIVTAMEYLINNPEIPHGTIRIGFTPDEEIGRGAHFFDVKQFGANRILFVVHRLNIAKKAMSEFKKVFGVQSSHTDIVIQSVDDFHIAAYFVGM